MKVARKVLQLPTFLLQICDNKLFVITKFAITNFKITNFAITKVLNIKFAFTNLQTVTVNKLTILCPAMGIKFAFTNFTNGNC